MLTVKSSVPKSIAIGGLMTAATLVAAFLYQRRKVLASNAENLLDACECALQRIGTEVSEKLTA